MNYLHNFFAHEVEGKVALQPYQALVKYTIRPLGGDKRYLLKFGTGLGKTYSAILALQNFARVDLGAFVVSYQQEIFRDELIKFGIDIPIDYYGYLELGNRLVTQVQEGQFRVNRALVRSMFNGVVVFDEVQKCYSRLHDTLQYIYVRFLTLLLRNRVTCVYLSATPLTYADEARDFLSLMQNHPVYSESQDELPKLMDRIQELEQQIKASSREDFVQQAIKRLLIPEDITADTEVTEALVLDTCRGRVLYVPELIGHEVPRVNMQGAQYKDIPNLPLVTCEAPLSFKAPQALISQAVSRMLSSEQSEREVAHESLRHIQFAGKSIQALIQGIEREDPRTINYCKENGIAFDPETQSLHGPFMHADRLGTYSPKFAKCIQNVLIKSGKSFIYFNQVKTYGVLFICQALRENGLLEHGESIKSTSICFKCRQRAENHDLSSKAEHQFQPFRFFKITGEEGMKYQTALDLFNNPGNDRGQHLQVVVGSQRVIQGFNFLAVNNVYILSFPFNMPNLIQVMGRAVRNRSHVTLPEEMQFVDTYIMINGFGATAQDIQAASREEIDIYSKCLDHRDVLEYERFMHKVALDVPIYGSRFINPGETSLKLLPFDHEQPALQPFTVKDPLQLLDSQNDLRDYYTSSVARDVLRQIREAVDNRFHISKVWRRDLLIASVRAAAVYPSLKGLSEESIMAVVHADPAMYAFGDYICTQEREQEETQRYAASAETLKPDVDFFLPGAGIQIQPLILKDMSQGAIDELRELFLYFSRECAPFLFKLLKGLGSKEDFHLIDSRRVLTVVRGIVRARVSDLDSLLSKGFVSINIQLCKQHEAEGNRAAHTMSKSGVCPKCIEAQKSREELANNTEVTRFLFTLLTHTAVVDAENRALAGYLSQTHERIFRFDTGRWHDTTDFANTITDVPLIIKSKSLTFRSAQGDRQVMRCPGITPQAVKAIAAQYNYDNINSCQQLVDVMWTEELQYRLSFVCKKIVVWKEFTHSQRR